MEVEILLQPLPVSPFPKLIHQCAYTFLQHTQADPSCPLYEFAACVFGLFPKFQHLLTAYCHPDAQKRGCHGCLQTNLSEPLSTFSSVTFNRGAARGFSSAGVHFIRGSRLCSSQDLKFCSKSTVHLHQMHSVFSDTLQSAYSVFFRLKGLGVDSGSS